MNRFKRIMGLVLMIAACCLPCRAVSLVLSTASANNRTIALGEIKQIDFGEQNVSIALTNGNTIEIAVSDFVALTNETYASGIVAIPASPESGVWTIYDLQGHNLGEATDGSKIAKGELPRGVYILKSGSRAIKVYVP